MPKGGWHRRKHGGKVGRVATPEYSCWMHMRSRCNNPNVPAYKDYGGRGIKVCARWDDFNNFLADMGPRPEGKSLDRWPDKNGNYEPGNCRWATMKEQQRNRRDSTRHVIGGVAATLAEWCEVYGVAYTTAARRISLGVPVEQALRKGRAGYRSVTAGGKPINATIALLLA